MLPTPVAVEVVRFTVIGELYPYLRISIPAPPSILPVTPAPLDRVKVSAAVPPVRLAMPVKLVPPTFPAPTPVMLQAEAALRADQSAA